MKLNPNQVNPILLRAKVALEANEKEKAQHFIEQAKQLNPQDPNTLQMLSQLLMGLNHADEAMEIINEAIGLSLEPLPLLLERAKLIHAMKGPKAKIDILIALLKDYPEEPKILVSMVKAYVENKQPEEAIRVAQEAIKLNNNKLDDKQKAELHFQLGTLLRQAGQLDQAIHDLKKSIDLAPHFIDAYMEIGEALRQRRQHQQAIEIFKQAIEIAPNNPQPYQEAGILLKDCKDYVGAEAMLRRAAALAPKDLNIRRQLGAVIALNIVHQPQDA
jgi:tetratricopeptide (TPR) repeat protein